MGSPVLRVFLEVGGGMGTRAPCSSSLSEFTSSVQVIPDTFRFDVFKSNRFNVLQVPESQQIQELLTLLLPEIIRTSLQSSIVCLFWNMFCSHIWLTPPSKMCHPLQGSFKDRPSTLFQ